jgi:hypothetical protein
MADSKVIKNKVSVGPSGSGALSSRLEGKGVALRSNLIFLAALALVVVAAALVS